MQYKIYILFLSFLLPAIGMAQQIPQYTQYIFNSLIINPAYAGTKESLNMNAISRYQWVGIEGAPKTQTFAMDGAINEKIGLGFHAIHDQTGIFRNSLLSGTFSYKINTSAKSKLSFGLSGGAFFNGINGSLTTTDVPDPLISQGIESMISPNAAAGIFFHTETFYAGISASELLAGLNNHSSNFQQSRHFFFTTGLVVPLNEALSLKTSILAKEDFKSSMAIDLNTFLLIYERLWIGGSWRSSAPIFMAGQMNERLRKRNSLALMMELYLNSALRVGYSYDITTSALRNFHTHEFSLGYSIIKQQDSRIKTPRYF
jgi:type IX secretion system PorP/SprF family membrane protein